MPDRWIDQHVGDEAHPRPGFEDALAADLHREWSGAPRRTWLRAGIAIAAAVALVVGSVVWSGRSEEHVITVDSTPTTAPVVDTVAETVATTTSVQDTSVPDTSVQDPALADGPAQPVKQYVVRLADGDYLGAAQLLGEGGLEPEARADLRPLFGPEFGLVPGSVTTETLAAALERWCSQALCVSPVDLQVVEGFNRAAVTYDIDGVQRTSTYMGGSFEGQPTVYGLPLQLPPGADLGATVECPTVGGIEWGTQTWADLDGDGWRELLVAQMTASAGDESGVVTYRVTTCGTTTRVEPFEITGDGLAIYPVNPMRSGPDTLLIGFLEGYPNGTMYQFDGTRLSQLPGTKWDLGPPISTAAQMSVGCADLLGDGTEAIVNYTFTEVDGQLRYSAAPAIGGGARTEGQVVADPDEAARIGLGYCHGLPIRAD